MPLQLGGSGFRPAQYVSPMGAEQAQLEKQATAQALRMQQWKQQHEMNALRDKQAATNLYNYMGALSGEGSNLADDSFAIGTFAYTKENDPFSGAGKQHAWENYKSQAINPDYQVFEKIWGDAKKSHNAKILSRIEMGARVGRMSGSEFNKMFSTPEFANWLLESGIDEGTYQRFQESTQYEPGYRTWGEALNPFSEKSIVQENPLITGGAVIGATAGGYGVRHEQKMSKLADLYLTRAKQAETAAEALLKQTYGEFKAPINPTSKKPYLEGSKTYQKAMAQYKVDKAKFAKEAPKRAKQAEHLKERAAARRQKAAGFEQRRIGNKTFKKVKGGLKGAAPYMASTLGRQAGEFVGGDTAGDVGQLAGAGYLGYKVGWPAAKKALAKIAPSAAAKLALAAADGPLPIGDILALGWTAWDIISALGEFSKKSN